MMSEVIPSALGRKQPAAFLSGPSFAKEIMDLRPTGVVAASKVIQYYFNLQNMTGASQTVTGCKGYSLIRVLCSIHC